MNMPVILLAVTLAGAGTVETESEKPYTDEDLYILSHIISAEAGNCSEDMMLSVGSVVLNRVADDRFPDTIEDVVFQKGQYSPTWNGAYYQEPTEGAQKVAEQLLTEGSQIDESVVWQAEFPQGNGVYDTIESPCGTTMYFCY
jgi:spore germination cell wall hydrolase CwlJ-like protein